MHSLLTSKTTATILSSTDTFTATEESEKGSKICEKEMPNALHKAFQSYFSKATRRNDARSPSAPPFSTATAAASPPDSSSRRSAASWIFSSCRFPKTPSFALDRNGDLGIHHFNTLFLADDSDLLPEFTSLSGSQYRSSFSTDSVARVPSEPVSAIASRRFMVVPGMFDSIVCHTVARGVPATPEFPPVKAGRLVRHGIAVATYSPDPFVDFRRSMQEMMEAREQERAIDWVFLEELLLCYLKLNHPGDHKFILGAFVDLLTCLAVDDDHMPDGRGNHRG